MKTILLGIALFVAVVYLPVTTSAQGYKWGPWSPDPCFSGVQFRARYDSYNEIAKKHHWYIQYKNNYTRDIAFSYNLGGSREEILKDIREKRGMYRTRIKPGQIDSGMWVFTNSQSQIFETIGHARLLGADEVDYKGPFMTCDSGGNRGQIDTICRNEPIPYFGCQNRPSPPPAAMTFPNKPWRNPASGKTTAASPPPASPSDCLDLYKYFSENKKSDDPLAVKQSIDAANAFKARCKLTDEQQISVIELIASANKNFERVQNKLRSLSSGDGDNLFTDANAVRKGPDVEQLKNEILENLKINVQPFERRGNGSWGVITDTWKNISVVGSADGITIKWTYVHEEKNSQISTSNSVFNVSYAALLSGTGNSIEEGSTCSTDSSLIWQGKAAGVYRNTRETHPTCLSMPYGMRGGNGYIELAELIQKIRGGGQVAEKEKGINGDEDTSEKLPLAVVDYERQVSVDAKAKGIKIDTDSTNQKPKPRPILTPRQRAAQNAEATKTLSELIQKDAEETAVEREKEARLGPIREIRKQIIENLRMNLKGTRECLAPRYGPCNKQFETVVDLSTDDELVIHLKPRDGSKAMEFRGRFDGLSPFCSGNSTTSSLWLTGIIPFKNVTIYPAGAPNEGVFSDNNLAFDYGTGNFFAMFKQCREISDLVKRLK
ncbi:MAG: hypothetical protein IPI64_09625 [Chloracidobacterium sp.]|nr:hypothetical protein [Chloracidobacterium sp.]